MNYFQEETTRRTDRARIRSFLSELLEGLLFRELQASRPEREGFRVDAKVKKAVQWNLQSESRGVSLGQRTAVERKCLGDLFWATAVSDVCRQHSQWFEETHVC